MVPLVNLGVEVRLAGRNLFRQLHRSLTALLTISVGVMALVLAQGYTEGMFREFRESAIRAEYGHLQLSLPEFHMRGRADPDSFAFLDIPEDIRAAVPPSTVFAPRYILTGLISAGDTSLPFSARGIDPSKDAQGGKALNIVSGDRLAENASGGVLLGRGLAKKLNVNVGDDIVLLVTTADDQLNARETPVQGIVAASSEVANDSLVLLPIALAMELRRQEGAHQQLLFLPTGANAETLADELRPLAASAGLELRHWLELADFYRRSEALFRQQLSVMVGIVVAILLLSISNTMMMSVLERTGEIGTAMALGSTRARVLRGFLFEGSYLGILGVVVGIGLAAVVALVLQWVNMQMPPPPGFSVGYRATIDLEPHLLSRVAIACWLATILAAVYPAWRASRLAIVDALRVVR